MDALITSSFEGSRAQIALIDEVDEVALVVGDEPTALGVAVRTVFGCDVDG